MYPHSDMSVVKYINFTTLDRGMNTNVSVNFNVRFTSTSVYNRISTTH